MTANGNLACVRLLALFPLKFANCLVHALWQIEVASQLFTGIVDGSENYIDYLPTVLYRKLTSPSNFW